MPAMKASFVMVVSVVMVALVAASCGGDSESTTTSSVADTTTTSSVADTTTTSAAPADVLITFDGATCSVSGGPLEPGLAEVLVLNTSPNPVWVTVVPLTSSYQVDDVAADVDAGRYQFGSDDPIDVESFEVVNMGPTNATEPSYNPFTATPGSFAVVCLDALGLKQFLAAEVFEVS